MILGAPGPSLRGLHSEGDMQLTLIIDGKVVKANAGASILEAATGAGVKIPTLCHDDRLHPYGACRICMVEVEGPPRRVLPACTTPVADGMTVHSMSPAVVEARKAILELLLINHPLDCPVCDKAGECRLQDLVHEYGLGPGEFAEEKRTAPSDYGSPAIERNQNRCIFCGKCVRVCSERCGVGALTFSMRGGRSRISAAFGGPLDCEFCGECVEICPVGALTTKQFKFKARAWNLEQTPSTCTFCGCGCPIILDRHRGAVVRVRSSDDQYLCVKGRFGWDAVRHEERLATPKMRVDGKLVDCSWEDALSVIATNLRVIRNRRGADSIGGLGSVRTTNEDNYLFQKFMRTVVGTNNVDLLARLKLPRGLNATFFSGELARMGEQDVVLLLDKDAGEVNPLLGIEIVRAVNRQGSRLILVNRGENKFNRIASVVIPQDADASLAGLTAALRSTRRAVSDRMRQAVEMLMPARSVAVIIPSRPSPETLALIQEMAGVLKSITYYPVIMRGNIQGALDMGMMPDYYPGYRNADAGTRALFGKTWDAALPETPGMNAVEMMSGIGRGLAALYIMGDDPAGSDPDLGPALQRLEFLVVQDIFFSETARRAHVVLPAASFIEKSGTITTIERRLRRLNKAEEPLAESKPDWEITQMLANRMGDRMTYASVTDIMNEIKSVVPMYKDLAIGGCWPPERSPLNGTIADLSLSSDAIMTREVITAGRLLFSSGMMATRSAELGSIARRTAERR
ncbi:MAG: molybdopterin-dependent oxidoreductase [Betaproteobacteria bacterium]